MARFLVVLFLLIPLTASAESYSTKFESEVGEEWSIRSTMHIEKQRNTFLGRFSNDEVTLTLYKPSDGYIRISFDLLVIDSWDGMSTEWGPDLWRMTINGKTILEKSFRNNKRENSQSIFVGYPEGHPGNSGGGRVFNIGDDSWEDWVIRFSRRVWAPEGDLIITFSGVGLQGVPDESWGLDNLTVTGAYSPATKTQDRFFLKGPGRLEWGNPESTSFFITKTARTCFGRETRSGRCITQSGKGCDWKDRSVMSELSFPQNSIKCLKKRRSSSKREG